MKTNRFIASLTAFLLAFLLASVSWGAATVWNGPTVSFSKASSANPNLSANQDRITDNVWLTRGATQGLFNIKTESSYAHNSSPAGTEWADGTTATYSSLTYTDWETWTGGIGSVPGILGRNAVVHLIADDIYLDLTFTSWGTGSLAGGSFSYTRSTPSVPSNLTWTGAVNEVWNLNTTANFSGNSSGKFNDGDHVTFNNTGSNTAITIAAGGVAPSSVTFSNTTTKNYSLSGGPLKGATSLKISGGGQVTLSSANSYTGGTEVSSGMLVITDASALPAGHSLTIGAGGTVVLTSGLANVSASAASVPEPSSWILLGAAGMVLALGMARRARVALKQVETILAAQSSIGPLRKRGSWRLSHSLQQGHSFSFQRGHRT